MKSAQPGEAALLNKATGDVIRAKVGDTVKGLGKITSIAKENGHWVVRGSQGQVTR